MTPSETSSSDRWARIQMAQLRSQQIRVEARGCTDPERLAVLAAEMRVIYDSMVEIRQEQLMEQIGPKPKPKRWWRFWR